MTTEYTDFVAEQFEQDKEAWKADHDEAMECYKLQDRLRAGLRFFNFIRYSDESWSRRVQLGETTFDEKSIRAIHDLYQLWLLPVDSVRAAIQHFEDQGFKVSGANEFREAIETVRSVTHWTADEIIRATGQIQRGETRTLEEVLGELEGGSKR
jgi:hypothetical protein